MSGHGHVTPNADGSKARCGGPRICAVCAHEAAHKKQAAQESAAGSLASSKKTLVASLTGCARCGSDHADVQFFAMENPSDPEYPHWGICPNGGGAILLKVLVGVQ